MTAMRYPRPATAFPQHGWQRRGDTAAAEVKKGLRLRQDGDAIFKSQHRVNGRQ